MSPLILKLDFTGELPIYQQICNQIVQGILSGQLLAGEKLPTIRVLAEELGINMMTVSKAYQILKQEGYITAQRRGGTVVCARQAAQVPQPVREELRRALRELRLTGISRNEALQLCSALLDEEEERP